MNLQRLRECIRNGTAPHLLHWASLPNKGGGGSAPAPDPMQAVLAQQQLATSKEQLELGREIFSWNKQQWDLLQPTVQATQELQLGEAKKNAVRADELWAQWEQYYKPLEQQFTKEVADLGGTQDQERAAATAAGEVGKAYDAEQGKLTRQAAAQGGVPADTMAGLSKDIALTKAADTAGSMTAAREGARLGGINARGVAVGMGRGLPTAGLSSSTAASSGAGLGMNTGAQNINIYNQGAMAGLSGTSAGANTTAQAMSALNADYSNRLNAWNIQQTADANEAAGKGQLIGTGVGAAATIAAAFI